MPSGRIVIEPQGEVTRIAGAIDESARLPEVLEHARAGRLVLDLGGVTFIDSLGIRDWIQLQQAARRAGIVVELRRVSEPVIRHFNVILAARGARVTSFFAPYGCDRCGREDAVLIDAVTHARRLAELAPPAMPCPTCGADMVFDDFPERYFSFLSV